MTPTDPLTEPSIAAAQLCAALNCARRDMETLGRLEDAAAVLERAERYAGFLLTGHAVDAAREARNQ